MTEAITEAEASRGAKAVIEARIAAGLVSLRGRNWALRDLRAVAEDTKRLGHAYLTLQSAEALGRAELERGTPENAEDTLRQALRQAESRDANGYAGTYRLRVLLAETQERLGQNSAAKRTRRNAAADLAKVREEVPERLRTAFDDLPGVAELLALSDS